MSPDDPLAAAAGTAVEISVCIASGGRREGLLRLLGALARQELPAGVDVETLVVDNTPGGGLREELAARLWPPPPGLRWLREPEANVARARNAALEAARGRWLAFVDDDEEPAPDWLAALWRSTRALRADGCFGPVTPRFEGTPAAWHPGEGFFLRPEHRTGAWVPRGELRSGNAFIRAELLAQQRFDPEFGRRGGEDSELFGRLQARGARFCWCQEARVVEWLPPERQRAGWLLRRAFRSGAASTRLEWRSGGPTAFLRALLRALLGMAVAAALLLLSLPRGLEAALRRGSALATQLGHLWAYVAAVPEARARRR